MNLKHLLLFVLLAGGLLTSNLAKAQDTLEVQILTLVNKYRAERKLRPLELYNTINTAAVKHSSDMASKKVPFGHAGFDARIDGLLDNIDGANAAAENVAYGPKSAEAVVQMWLNSSGHRKNIEGDFTLTGIGIVRDKNGLPYYTQIFVRK